MSDTQDLDNVMTSLVDILEHMSVFKTSTYSSIQTLWDVGVGLPSVDSIFADEELTARFIDGLDDKVVNDIITVYARLCGAVDSSTLDGIVPQLISGATAYYAGDVSILSTLKVFYKKNPHYLVLRLIEQCTVTDAGVIGVKEKLSAN